jgi:hypothetical protein
MAAVRPTSPLSKARDALWLALSRHLGALTPVWVVPLSAPRLTPGSPTPAFSGGHGFGVGLERLEVSLHTSPIRSSTP